MSSRAVIRRTGYLSWNCSRHFISYSRHSKLLTVSYNSSQKYHTTTYTWAAKKKETSPPGKKAAAATPTATATPESAVEYGDDEYPPDFPAEFLPKAKNTGPDPAHAGLKRVSQAKIDEAVNIHQNTVPSNKAERLINALFLEASQFEGAVGAVASDLAALDKLLYNEVVYKKLFCDPIVPRSAKREGLIKYVENTTLHPITTKFLRTIATEYNPEILTLFYEPFKKMADIFTKTYEVDLKIAKPLEQPAIDKLISEIKALFPPESHPDFKVTVDPFLLDGYKASIGTEVFLDSSMRTPYEEKAEQYSKEVQRIIDGLNLDIKGLQNVKPEPIDLSKMTVDSLLRGIFDPELHPKGETTATVQTTETSDEVGGADPDWKDTRFSKINELYGFEEDIPPKEEETK